MDGLSKKYPMVYDVLVIAVGIVLATGLISLWGTYVTPKLKSMTSAS